MKNISGISKINEAVYLENGNLLSDTAAHNLAHDKGISLENANKNTISYGILSSHNTSADEENLKIKFDALASHDITYVGIIQTARASGLREFPIPYVLTNCHNSLCAVGGTINEDDHVFGLSAAKKYGGIYVPPHIAVIHQYMREMFAGCGKMILGSDSHTRYGALGTMAIGEGGPELVKQLLSKTYDIKRPETVAVYLTGKPAFGVGPQDVALSIIGATFEDGFVKNSVMEFVGPGVANLSVDYRIGIDVMTTETTCLSSVWETDEKVEEFLALHGRGADYKKLTPCGIAKYDRAIIVDLSAIKATVALPFHPSNVYSIDELCENAKEILTKVENEINATSNVKISLADKIIDGKIRVEQGIIAGCAGGGFENICEAASILENADIGDGEYSLSVYPASQPVYIELVRNGTIEKLMSAGATVRTAFCGPCFGADNVPANNGLSVRHSTRNFPNREGSKPAGKQIASVALMDARSIAATSANKGILTSAQSLCGTALTPVYHFDKAIYDKRVFSGKADASSELKFGPNIADWPAQIELKNDILLVAASKILDPITTTDELIPSGETSSYRSNPLKLAEFTLSRKDPEYVGRVKTIKEYELTRQNGKNVCELSKIYEKIAQISDTCPSDIEIGSVVCAIKPGDGSAREQAASCQRVLGGLANIAHEYATKRYRSNLINWGMIPFIYDDIASLNVNDAIYIKDIYSAIKNGAKTVSAYVISGENTREITLGIVDMTKEEREILLCGCLINYYSK